MNKLLNGSTWRPPYTESYLFLTLVALTLSIEAAMIIGYLLPEWKTMTRKRKFGLGLCIVIANVVSALAGLGLYNMGY